ncbi:MAG TPA: lytic transglycosylase domain-containing protein [Thermoanaerobaculaceae bacterium]|nr:lytic transglycosylase domain-containing protein [Thermoanaerobaculaceae bacterium]
MFGGRQTIAVWGCFAIGALLASLAQRPRATAQRPSNWTESVPGGSVPLESDPFAGPTPFEQRVIADATRVGIDPALVIAVIEVESGEAPDAVSPKGAIGLMQVLPETAAEIGFPNPADPARNLEAGCRYLASLLETFGGDVELSLAAYNAGPGAVRHWGTVPPYRETRVFIQRVAAVYERLTGLDLAGATRFAYEPSPAL